MHDADGPKKPIHSLRDFAFHIFTVMVGLLLALGLESIVEWRHHAHLAHQAKENIRTEITKNRKYAHAIVDVIPGEKQYLLGWLAIADEVGTPAGPGAPPKNATWNFIPLLDGNYQMAHANNALGYMPISDATVLIEAYTEQSLFGQAVANALSAWTDMRACGKGIDDLAKMTPADATCVRTTSRTLLARLEIMDVIGKAVDELYAKALGSESPKGR